MSHEHTNTSQEHMGQWRHNADGYRNRGGPRAGADTVESFVIGLIEILPYSTCKFTTHYFRLPELSFKSTLHVV